MIVMYSHTHHYDINLNNFPQTSCATLTGVGPPTHTHTDTHGHTPTEWLNDLTRLPSKASSSRSMTSGLRSHWLIENPQIFPQIVNFIFKHVFTLCLIITIENLFVMHHPASDDERQ